MKLSKKTEDKIYDIFSKETKYCWDLRNTLNQPLYHTFMEFDLSETKYRLPQFLYPIYDRLKDNYRENKIVVHLQVRNEIHNIKNINDFLDILAYSPALSMLRVCEFKDEQRFYIGKGIIFDYGMKPILVIVQNHDDCQAYYNNPNFEYECYIHPDVYTRKGYLYLYLKNYIIPYIINNINITKTLSFNHYTYKPVIIIKEYPYIIKPQLPRPCNTLDSDINLTLYNNAELIFK